MQPVRAAGDANSYDVKNGHAMAQERQRERVDKDSRQMVSVPNHSLFSHVIFKPSLKFLIRSALMHIVEAQINQPWYYEIKIIYIFHNLNAFHD